MRIGVVGAGEWGTTMAILLAEKGCEVVLWARDPGRAKAMQQARENEVYLPSFRFPSSLTVAEGDLPDCDYLFCAVPTQHVREIFSRLRARLPKAPIVSLTKGIEIGTGELPTGILRDVLGEGSPTAVLTGPCIAREVARGKPTAVVIAGAQAKALQELCATPRLRVYTSDDKVGCELAAGLKNVMGIAAGIVDGLGLGDNAKATLLTRGIVELTRLGVTLGAKPSTFTGLAGFGDLFTTCVSPHGRNRGVGERIGKGETIDAILAGMKSVAEGVPTTRAVTTLARERGVEMPITEALYKILFEGASLEQAIAGLMTRVARPEAL